MEDCLFCMIAEGKIPSKKLYEDEQVVAFYDINPQAKGALSWWCPKSTLSLPLR